MSPVLPLHDAAQIPAERRAALRSRGSEPFLDSEIHAVVRGIFDEVAQDGDAAVAAITARIDGQQAAARGLWVPQEEIAAAEASLRPEVADGIRLSIENHRRYSAAVAQPALQLFEIAPGVVAGRQIVPLERVALYVPAGKGSYPSSFVTVAAPAVEAGVGEIAVVVPPSPTGEVDAAVLAAAHMLGIDRIYRANGIAGIAAAALGTESLPRVEKIVGPGSPAIMAAQVHAQLHGVAVALFFGPTECMVIADDSADAELVAADLLNEAEHGANSSAILLTDSRELAMSVQDAVERQLATLEPRRRDYASAALANLSAIVVVQDLDEAVALANEWGNEHIQVATRDAWGLAHRLTGASEILVGQMTTFSAISYAIGVPACLPTGRFAKIFDPVTVDTFVRRGAITALDREGLERLAPAITSLARHEGFPAHERSIGLRRERGVLRAEA